MIKAKHRNKHASFVTCNAIGLLANAGRRVFPRTPEPHKVRMRVVWRSCKKFSKMEIIRVEGDPGQTVQGCSSADRYPCLSLRYILCEVVLGPHAISDELFRLAF